jgi:uncharacterized protein
LCPAARNHLPARRVTLLLISPQKTGDIARSVDYSRARSLEVAVKRIFLALTACLIFSLAGVAQQSPADAPATREDIERYLEVTHSRDMMKQIMDVMAKNVREMAHDQLSKDRASLPPDADERMNKRTDVLLKNLPIEEMLQAMIPVYQKHWTKGDVDNMIAFYATSTGQKLLKDMPQTMAEAMQAMRPVVEKHMETMKQQLEQEVVQLKKEYKNGPNKPAAPPVSN